MLLSLTDRAKTGHTSESRGANLLFLLYEVSLYMCLSDCYKIVLLHAAAPNACVMYRPGNPPFLTHGWTRDLMILAYQRREGLALEGFQNVGILWAALFAWTYVQYAGSCTSSRRGESWEAQAFLLPSCLGLKGTAIPGAEVVLLSRSPDFRMTRHCVPQQAPPVYVSGNSAMFAASCKHPSTGSRL